MTERCIIIAEAGVNHNGSIEMALELVDRAADAGADFVKFQTFRAKELVSASAAKASYQLRATGAQESQLEMLKRLELSPENHRILIERCQRRGIAFLSTPFDLASLYFLTTELGQPVIKLGSGELTNAPLLLAAARSGVRLIVSTGMGTLGEVEEALGVLGYGMIGGTTPSRAAFAAALHQNDVWDALRKQVTLLHCTTEYPAPIEETNLRVLATLSQAFGLAVGYSDHTEGNAVSFAAVALGASVLEKHFTLDRALPGPDHAASLEPGELVALVQGIRGIEKALGTGRKQPGRSELSNRSVARKSLHAARDLPRGHVLCEDDIKVMRPGSGMSAMDFWDVQGRALTADARADSYLCTDPISE